jgi:ABC-2 type transport system permease protein
MSNTATPQAFVWLLRRELWENRGLWLAPAAFAALVILLLLAQVLFGGHVSLGLADGDFHDGIHNASGATLASMMSFGLVFLAAPFFLIALIMQFMYAVDALYGERRDRSILFWKSMPVSDAQTVLSKLAVAAFGVFVPALLATIATQLALAVVASIDLREYPSVVAHVWSPAAWGSALLVLLYVTVVATLWFLPVVAWCLLVSARAPRSPLLWATLPPLAIALAERIVFHTHVFGSLIFSRLMLPVVAVADPTSAIQHPEHAPLVHHFLEPLGFLTSPALWLGLVAAAAMVWAAIWSRRQGEATS